MKKVLIAYFSQGGTTAKIAAQIKTESVHPRISSKHTLSNGNTQII